MDPVRVLVMGTEEKQALKLCRGILDDAVKNGAHCIVTICPLCQMNLDVYQSKVNVLSMGTLTNFSISSLRSSSWLISFWNLGPKPAHTPAPIRRRTSRLHETRPPQPRIAARHWQPNIAQKNYN